MAVAYDPNNPTTGAPPAQPGYPTSGSTSANAWQNQWTPQMGQDAINYGASHPAWQGYSQIMAGYTPNQIMQGQAPSPSSLGASTQQQGGSSLDEIFAMLQGQNAPQNQAIDLLKQQLGIDVGNETKLTGLKESDLKATTAVGMARANKLIQNSQDEIANIGKQRGFVGQVYNEANQAAKLSYQSDRANLLSDATARGAVGAHGTVDQFGRQYENFANQLASNTTGKNKSLADLQLQEQQANNVAQQYGIDKNALQEKLSNGLQQLGVQGQIDLGDLFKQATSLDAQKAGNAQSVISQLLGMAEQNPSLMNQLPGFLGGGSGGSAPAQSFAGGSGHRMQ